LQIAHVSDASITLIAPLQLTTEQGMSYGRDAIYALLYCWAMFSIVFGESLLIMVVFLLKGDLQPY
jgi:hypothetical protein